MTIKTRLLALAGLACVATTPAAAQDEVAAATQVRNLDMMLMVTSLRCRFGSSDFRPEYQALRARHQLEIRNANQRVLSHLTSQMGRRAAVAAYDRMSTGMANQYGGGHPWLDCSALKDEVSALTQSPEPVPLRIVAGDWLAKEPPASSQSQTVAAAF